MGHGGHQPLDNGCFPRVPLAWAGKGLGHWGRDPALPPPHPTRVHWAAPPLPAPSIQSVAGGSTLRQVSLGRAGGGTALAQPLPADRPFTGCVQQRWLEGSAGAICDFCVHQGLSVPLEAPGAKTDCRGKSHPSQQAPGCGGGGECTHPPSIHPKASTFLFKR